MDRRRLGSRISERRSRTPYDRPPTTPSRDRSSSGPSTPSSIFSKVREIFTPSRLWSRQTPSVSDNDDLQSTTSSMTETLHSKSLTNVSDDGKFTYPAPLPAPRPNLGKFQSASDSDSNDYRRSMTPLSSIAYPPSASPNERLKEFFRSKGDEKLSDIEVAGVMALIQQASHRNESVLDQYSPSVTSERPISTIESGTVSPVFEESQLHGTPSLRGDLGRNTPPIRSPRYTPLYSRSSTSSRNLGTPTGSSSKVHKSFHYNNIPTPYRPGLKRSLGSLISSRTSTTTDYGVIPSSPNQHGLLSDISLESDSIRSESTVADVDTNNSNMREAPTNDNMEGSPSSERPLSHTASALLSLLDTDSSDNLINVTKKSENKEKKDKIPDNIQKFVSPYSSRPRLSTPRKPQLTSRQSEPSLRSPAVRELEMSRPKESNAFQYKPTKSSSLRQSLVASPEKNSPEPIEIDGDFPQESPKVLFSFKPTDDKNLKTSFNKNMTETIPIDSSSEYNEQKETTEKDKKNAGQISIVSNSMFTKPNLKLSDSLSTPTLPKSNYSNNMFAVSPSKPLFTSVDAASPQVEINGGASPPSTKEVPFTFGVSIKATETTNSSTNDTSLTAASFRWPDVPIANSEPLTENEESRVQWLRENVYRF